MASASFDLFMGGDEGGKLWHIFHNAVMQMPHLTYLRQKSCSKYVIVAFPQNDIIAIWGRCHCCKLYCIIQGFSPDFLHHACLLDEYSQALYAQEKADIKLRKRLSYTKNKKVEEPGSHLKIK